jgi:hypothetical protein
MIPLVVDAADCVRTSDDAPHRSVALRHAAIHRRPGLFVDDPERPASLVWLRKGDEGGWEAFAEGIPGPTLEWLRARARGEPIALLAPPSWEGHVRALGGRIETGTIQTWLRPDPSNRPSTRFEVRRLAFEDGPAFEAAAPAWSLRSWGDFEAMIARGAAFGIPAAVGLAAMAWTYESDHQYAKVGVATLPRFRERGLGRAVAWALVEHIVLEGRRRPLWVTTPANDASSALARSLGFSTPIAETLLRWAT